MSIAFILLVSIQKSHCLQKPESLCLFQELKWKLLEHTIVQQIQTFIIFLESFMLVLYGSFGIFFGMNWRYLVCGLLHHVKVCQ